MFHCWDVTLPPYAESKPFPSLGALTAGATEMMS